MGKKQTRIAISISGRTARRLRRWCERTQQSMAGTIERLANEHLDRMGEPAVTHEQIRSDMETQIAPSRETGDHLRDAERVGR